MPASMVSTMVSTSKTQPPHVPPEACWRAAQSLESSGRLGCGSRSSGSGRASSWASPQSAPRLSPFSPTRFIVPSRVLRSMTISIRSPSLTLPIGPPARASGPTCPYAGAGGDAGEAGVGDERDVLAVGQVLERGGYLIDLLHAGAERPAAGEYHYVAGLYLLIVVAALDGGYGGPLGAEYPSRAGVPIHAVVVNDGGVYRGALYDRAFGGEISGGEADGAGEAARLRPVGRHYHVVGVNAGLGSQVLADVVAALGVFPPVQVLA